MFIYHVYNACIFILVLPWYAYFTCIIMIMVNSSLTMDESEKFESYRVWGGGGGYECNMGANRKMTNFYQDKIR